MRDPIRNAGFIACLVGALVLVASRYITGAPHELRWVGLAIVVLGWALFAWSMIRRARLQKVNG